MKIIPLEAKIEAIINQVNPNEAATQSCKLESKDHEILSYIYQNVFPQEFIEDALIGAKAFAAIPHSLTGSASPSELRMAQLDVVAAARDPQIDFAARRSKTISRIGANICDIINFCEFLLFTQCINE
ncbi:hypothetical protein G9A89_016812 [Geosiphon pyriformis]|nr:hypothetical protein G9A89_016812 [Geosiphon pyriformis]